MPLHLAHATFPLQANVPQMPQSTYRSVLSRPDSKITECQFGSSTVISLTPCTLATIPLQANEPQLPLSTDRQTFLNANALCIQLGCAATSCVQLVCAATSCVQHSACCLVLVAKCLLLSAYACCLCLLQIAISRFKVKTNS